MATMHLVLGLLLLFAARPDTDRARATAQTPDVIELDGKNHPLLVNPLESYLIQNPGRRPRRSVMSTANWRGYVAHFAIINSQLTLTDVRIEDGSGDGSYRSAREHVFPDSARVTATWFTGNLIIPDGERVSYVHMGYASEYERYRVVRVERGVAAPPRALSHAEFRTFRQTQFEAFRKTTEYSDMLKREQMKSGADSLKDPVDMEGFMFVFAVAEYMARIFE